MKQALGSGRVIWVAVALAFTYVIWFNYHKYVITQRYDFFVEAPCDPREGVSCHLRSCEDYCPPNELESYRVWKINARDFGRCADDTCDTECRSGQLRCEAVPCDPEVEECS